MATKQQNIISVQRHIDTNSTQVTTVGLAYSFTQIKSSISMRINEDQNNTPPCLTPQFILKKLNHAWQRLTGSGPPFRRVRPSESRHHSWSLQGIVLDIATTRRLTLTLTLTLTVSLTVSCYSWKWLKMRGPRNGGPSEWRPLGMASQHCLTHV